MSTPLETRQDLRPVSGEFVPTWFESLENRRLLSGTGDILMQPALSLSPDALNSTVVGLTPAQIKKAYGFDQLSGDGSGQTIAIVDAYNDPNISSDLSTFSKQFSLANPNLSVVNQTGGSTNLPKTDGGWAQEISLDVEWAHAIAPKAKILLVEAKSASLSDLLAGVDTARHADGVSVVSMSWGTNEFFTEGNYDSYFTTPAGHQGVTFVASSGDEGSWAGASWPAVSSNVLSVGGTTLNISDSSGTYGGETGWSGSGGGVSDFISEPSYQSQYGNIGGRGAPDVSYNANPYTGFAVYDSLSFQGSSGWMSIGGTSAGAPQWGALIAIANQGRVAAHGTTLDGATGTLPAIYSLYNANDYTNNFHDVTFGRSSWWYGAHQGWDAVTGLGTPKAGALVGFLSGFGLPTSTGNNSVIANSSPVRKTTARPQIAQVAPPQPAVALAAAPAVGSVFSNVQLPATIENLSISMTSPHSGGSSQSGLGSSGPGDAGFGSTSDRGSMHLASEHHSMSSESHLPLRSVSVTESNPLRHLMRSNPNDQTFVARPGKIYSPSTYDVASIAARSDDSDGMLDWKQLAALLGTGILVGSYAIESHRRKRAMMSMWPGIDSER